MIAPMAIFGAKFIDVNELRIILFMKQQLGNPISLLYQIREIVPIYQ